MMDARVSSHYRKSKVERNERESLLPVRKYDTIRLYVENQGPEKVPVCRPVNSLHQKTTYGRVVATGSLANIACVLTRLTHS
jgi:hypothetical protein